MHLKEMPHNHFQLNDQGVQCSTLQLHLPHFHCLCLNLQVTELVHDQESASVPQIPEPSPGPLRAVGQKI